MAKLKYKTAMAAIDISVVPSAPNIAATIIKGSRSTVFSIKKAPDSVARRILTLRLHDITVLLKSEFWITFGQMRRFFLAIL